MGFADFSRNFASGLGKFVGTGLNVFISTRKVLRKSVAKLRPQPSREKIRSIVTEELIHLMGKEAKFAGTEFEERLQVMTEALEALQEKIAQLSARGLPSETLVSAVIASVEEAVLLSNEEKAILVSIFRQNVAIQKPDLTHATVKQASLEVCSP